MKKGRQSLTAFLFFIIAFSCKKETDKVAVVQRTSDSIVPTPANEKVLPTKKYDYEIGWMETYEKLSKLEFIEVTEYEFNTALKDSARTLPKLKTDKENFTILTKGKQHIFNLYRDYGDTRGHEGHEYLGYYPKLKLFAITSNWTGESMGFGKLVLIDSITDKEYAIQSINDGSVQLPIPSKNNKFMVYYDNWIYQEKDCTICVVKIGSKSGPDNYLQEYASYESHEFAIEEIRWIDDNSFVVKGYEEVYENNEWLKKFKYYKTSFR